MKLVRQLVGTLMAKEGMNYIEKNPVENFPKLINWAQKLAIKEDHKDIIKMISGAYNDSTSNWSILIKRILTELDLNVRKKFLINYFLNAGMIGQPITEALREKYKCNIPWAILMDPTAACNLSCTGCWAAEYKKSASLSLELMDRIIEEGKELGVYMFIYSGGEPLIRKEDMLKLAEKHDDCIFLSFTNATLIDEDFVREVQRLGNLIFAISVEGFKDETDMRRGEGTFDKVMKAMDILKKYGIGFGFSTCYHSKNTDKIGSDEYIDLMVEKGCMFGWYFTYMPIGKGAVMDLVARPEQREYMYHRVRDFRQSKPIFVLDFWNDGEYVDGCIAGGRRYLHINANGDVEPCAFIHYSNVNIKDTTLLEALRSPLFMEYKKNQPFNKNQLKPCPLLDNPNMLKEMVRNSNAASTQLVDQESVDEVTDKCQDISRNWTPTADKIWNDNQASRKEV